MNEVEIVQDYNVLAEYNVKNSRRLTSYTCKELSCKALDLTVWKGYKGVSFQEIKDALT